MTVQAIPTKKAYPSNEDNPAALVVGPNDADLAVLQKMFDDRGWRITAVDNVGAGLNAMSRQPPRLVLCDEHLGDGDWKSILAATMNMQPRQPSVIVTSRLADARLWAEVLNLGGYDVLAKPYDRTELIRVIATALRCSGILDEMSVQEHRSRANDCRQ